MSEKKVCLIEDKQTYVVDKCLIKLLNEYTTCSFMPKNMMYKCILDETKIYEKCILSDKVCPELVKLIRSIKD